MSIRKTTIFVLMVLLLFSITGCTSKADKENTSGMNVTADASTPEGTVKLVFDALKKGNLNTLDKYVYIDVGVKSGSIKSMLPSDYHDALFSEDNPVTTGLTGDFEYKILKSDVKEDKATVKVQVKNRDFSKTLKNFKEAGGFETNPDMTLEELIDSAKGNTVTTELSLPVVKKEGVWTVTLNLGALNGVLGKVISMDLMSLMGNFVN